VENFLDTLLRAYASDRVSDVPLPSNEDVAIRLESIWAMTGSIEHKFQVLLPPLERTLVGFRRHSTIARQPRARRHYNTHNHNP
jgi:hypothetical protein